MLQTERRGFYASPTWYALQVGGRETVSNIRPNALLREAGWICWCYYTTIRAKRKVAGPKACHFWKPEKKLRLILRQD